MAKQSVDLQDANVLVTGAAGFIGAALVERLIRDGSVGSVIGIDDLNDYYDVDLKLARIARIERSAASSSTAWAFERGNIADEGILARLFEEYRPKVVINLAAQAGVRYSIDNPWAYIQSNIIGFHRVLEACRTWPVEHLVYASSSSVYGGNRKVPFAVGDPTDTPVSLYAATKKSDELLAHAYAKLYDIPTTGLRFFTVYGPWGRPDMFVYSATERLASGGSIQLYNEGECWRDFTYIDDIVEGIVRVMAGAPIRRTGEDGLPIAPYALYNIGGGHPERVLDMVDTLQGELVRAGLLPSGYDFDAHRTLVGMQPGDVVLTCADTQGLLDDFGFSPTTRIADGLHAFVDWYVSYRDESLRQKE